MSENFSHGSGKGHKHSPEQDFVLINFYLTPKELYPLFFSQIVQSRAQEIDERLTALDAKQADTMAQFKAEQTPMISETNAAIMATLETAVRKYVRETTPSNVHSITEAVSRKTSKKGERDIDKVIWPLLNSGMTVRAIAERTNTSTATVGRSRKRWEASSEMLQVANGKTTPETAIRMQEATI